MGLCGVIWGKVVILQWQYNKAAAPLAFQLLSLNAVLVPPPRLAAWTLNVAHPGSTLDESGSVAIPVVADSVICSACGSGIDLGSWEKWWGQGICGETVLWCRFLQ